MLQSDLEKNRKRLRDIAEIKLSTLSDDEILRLVTERKELFDLELEYKKKEQEEEKLRLEKEKSEESQKVEKKKADTLRKIAELNTLITPDKQDDALLDLVTRRRELEKELASLGGGALPAKGVTPSASHALVQTPAEAPLEKKEVVVQDEEGKSMPRAASSQLKVTVEEDFGQEKIRDYGIEEGSQFKRYFDQLKSNVASLGELLQEMPLDAKKNKAFMLKVAEIDPAYAMHYADKETLKKDEDFNVHIASLGNSRNSGNALAEMLPEARTSNVVLVAVKRDYRNVRFIQPDMVDYDEILTIAKKAALDTVKNLKEAADITSLIPKLLQQDKEFMLQVREMTALNKKD